MSSVNGINQEEGLRNGDETGRDVKEVEEWRSKNGMREKKQLFGMWIDWDMKKNIYFYVDQIRLKVSLAVFLVWIDWTFSELES